MQNQNVTVSLCIVALNEEKYLGSLLNDICQQDYCHSLIEIILVDSGSTDETKEIMSSFSKSENDFRCVKVVDNIKRIQSAGWNLAITNANCDIIARIDAHSKLPFDFISKNVKNINDGEFVSGGKRPCLIENKTLWGDVLLRTENSLFGSSINASKHSNTKKYVKTMFHACYRKEVFEKVGLFNEKLLRTEDNEMHYRIRKNGYRLCYDPSILSYQYARNSLKKSIKQKFQNGYWIGITTGVCPNCLSIYHFAPFCFVIALVTFSIFAFFGFWYLIAGLGFLYFSFCIINSIASMIGNKFNPFTFLMPAFFFLLHFSYGVGTLVGLIKMLFTRRKYL